MIILTMFDDEMNALRFFSNGANAFVSKNFEPEVLKKAIDVVSVNDYYIDINGNQSILRRMHSGKKEPEITEKEKQFIKLCPTDLTYDEIALQMKTNLDNVHAYRDSLFSKFDIHSRTRLVIIGIILGIIILRN